MHLHVPAIARAVGHVNLIAVAASDLRSRIKLECVDAEEWKVTVTVEALNRRYIKGEGTKLLAIMGVERRDMNRK